MEEDQPVTKAELFEIIQDVKGDIVRHLIQMDARIQTLETEMAAIIATMATKADVRDQTNRMIQAIQRGGSASF